MSTPNEQNHESINAIKEKAVKIACDYPNIENCDWMEQLYAIESSYEGTCLANDDCHRFIDVLRLKLGMTKEETVDLWIKTRFDIEKAAQA